MGRGAGDSHPGGVVASGMLDRVPGDPERLGHIGGADRHQGGDPRAVAMLRVSDSMRRDDLWVFLGRDGTYS